MFQNYEKGFEELKEWVGGSDSERINYSCTLKYSFVRFNQIPNSATKNVTFFGTLL